MEQITAREIARLTNLPIRTVRTWDGYEAITDTVELSEAEVAGLWNLANGVASFGYTRTRLRPEQRRVSAS